MARRQSTSPPAHDVGQQFPPHVLREYAVLADGQRGALVGPRGDIAWMCAPRWDSGALFSALIGGAGNYAVCPLGRFVWGGYYESSSLIWRSRWITENGIVECREALAFPGDPGRVVLLRRITATQGDARVLMLLDPRADFGRSPARRPSLHDGIWTMRSGPLHLRWAGAAQAQPGHLGHDEHALACELRLPAGQTHNLVLEVAEHPLDEEPIDADRAWRATEQSWAAAVPTFDETIAPADTRHSYAVMRGLTCPGGGMVAAVTTSLPERAGQGRNYDYRYAWIRDQCLAGQAVAAAGGYPLLDDAVAFVTDRLCSDGPELRPAYTIVGGHVPDEHSLRLPGYPGGRDIVGNKVNQQFQLDGFGEGLLLLAAAQRHDRLDADGWRAAEIAADAIAKRWREPDAGVWELEPTWWAESRLLCVAGLRAVAAGGGPAPKTGEWLALADAILAETAASCAHPSGRWQRAPDDERVDAALLLPVIRGALPATDPRGIATVDALLAELASDGYLYRFRHEAGRLGDAEGAFLLCGFVMALALHQQGRELEANRWFERNRAACGPPGLYSEEYDVAQRQLRGNVPQAFVHAAMFEAAVRLATPWREETKH